MDLYMVNGWKKRFLSYDNLRLNIIFRCSRYSQMGSWLMVQLSTVSYVPGVKVISSCLKWKFVGLFMLKEWPDVKKIKKIWSRCGSLIYWFQWSRLAVSGHLFLEGTWKWWNFVSARHQVECQSSVLLFRQIHRKMLLFMGSWNIVGSFKLKDSFFWLSIYLIYNAATFLALIARSLTLVSKLHQLSVLESNLKPALSILLLDHCSDF